MKKYILRILYIIYALGFIAMTFTIGFSLNKNINNQPLNGSNINNSNSTVKDVSLGKSHSSAIVNDGINDHLGLGDESVESNEFSLQTPMKEISSLSNVQTNDIT